jgi:hypothetical protein
MDNKPSKRQRKIREAGNDNRTSLAALARPIIGARASPADRLARAKRSRHRLSAGLRTPPRQMQALWLRGIVNPRRVIRQCRDICYEYSRGKKHES